MAYGTFRCTNHFVKNILLPLSRSTCPEKNLGKLKKKQEEKHILCRYGKCTTTVFVRFLASLLLIELCD